MPQREVHDCPCGSPGRASGHKTDDPCKKAKVSDEEKEGDSVGQSCFKSSGASFIHGHADLPAITRKAQNRRMVHSNLMTELTHVINKVWQWKHRPVTVL